MTTPATRERGASMPETAIVMAVLLALLVGIMYFGRAMYTYAFVAQLAREGARWAIVRGSHCSVLDHCGAQPSDVQAYVRSLSEGLTDPDGIDVDTTWPQNECLTGESGKDPGCVVSVAVTYKYSWLLPFMPMNGNQALVIPMSSTSQMSISQ